MEKAVLNIEQFNIQNGFLDVKVSFKMDKMTDAPRIAILFESGEYNRRVPMPVEISENTVFASGRYEYAYIFYRYNPKNIKIKFVFSDGISNGEIYDTDLIINDVHKNSLSHLKTLSKREVIKDLVGVGMSLLAFPFRLLPIKKNRISFITNRTLTPTGNLKAVYDTLVDKEEFDVKLLCHNAGGKAMAKNFFKFIYMFMTSRIVYVDDYYHFISYIKTKKNTTIIQLWHGVGAFKTFGFSRFHKDSKLQLYSVNHRQYDYAIVSSSDVTDDYAEAFGINRQNVLPLGSPRCDLLVNEEYKKKVKEKFDLQYPHLKDKKLLLFAPTFRGGGNGDAFYPMDKFDVDKVLDILGDDWGVVIKLHPYLKEEFTCSSKHQNQFAVCNEWDVNDVLIATDFLVTDYSSVIFEAALLEKPMAFLAFDEEEFSKTRDSFLEFKHFVPAKIVKTDEEVAIIAKNNDVDMNSILAFKRRAFGENSGKACENMLNLTRQIINNK